MFTMFNKMLLKENYVGRIHFSEHFLMYEEVGVRPETDTTVPEIIDPVFTKTSPKRSFSFK
jgi:hypothetical protein